MEKLNIEYCPYCKSKNFEHMCENGCWNGRSGNATNADAGSMGTTACTNYIGKTPYETSE